MLFCSQRSLSCPSEHTPVRFTGLPHMVLHAVAIRLGLCRLPLTVRCFVSLQVNSSSPFPEDKHGRHFSSESTYSHSSAEDSRQDAAGSTHSSGCRPPYRERRSWQDLIETPLTSSGLHFLQTVPPEAEYASGRAAMSPEKRRQATLPVQRRHNYEQDGPFPLVECPRGHSSHSRPQKQRSQSLPRNRDVRGKGRVKSIEGTDDKLEEKVPIRRHNSFCAEGELLKVF